MNTKKLLAGAIAVSMLAASASVSFAMAPADYDGAYYDSLGLKSDDPDGEINLAVIANGDVNIYGDTMYILGSVYSNGTIYAGNGQGNKIDGLFISGTENETYGSDTNNDSWTQYRTTKGYVHVNDYGKKDDINYYSTQPEVQGSVLDNNTSFDYEVKADDFKVPSIANSSTRTEVNEYGGAWDPSNDTSPMVVSENTYFKTLKVMGDALDIDVSKGDVTVVIDKLLIGSATPTIDVIGTEGNNNKAYLYINDYDGDKGEVLEIAVNIANSKGDWRLYSGPSSDEQAHEYLDLMGDKDRIDFHLSRGGQKVVLGHARIAANTYISGSEVNISGASWVDGNVTVDSSTLNITDGATYVRGTVYAPAAASQVVNSATVYGQVYVDTLTINGAGRILYKGDSITEDPADKEETKNTGDTVIDIEKTVYVKISEVNDKTVTFNVSYSTPSDDKTYTLKTSDIGGDHTEDLRYASITAGDGNNWSSNNVISNASGDTVTITFPNWFSGYSSRGLQAGTECLVTVTANDGSGATDSVKIIFVDDDFVEPTEAPAEPENTPEPVVTPEPTEKPDVPEPQSVVRDSGYAYIFGYEPALIEDEEGNITTEIHMGPMDSATREQVAAMITRMLDQLKGSQPKYKLTDNIAQYDGTWFVRGLACLNSKGAFDGEVYTGPISRGEVAKLIVKGFDLEGTADVPYEDVAGNDYEEFIATMYHFGLMTGTSDTTFEPNRVMTRAEFCKLFNNIIGRESLGLETADGETITPATYSIVDVNPGAWYYETVLKATSAYDNSGNVDLQKRADNIRNKLDEYDSQLLY